MTKPILIASSDEINLKIDALATQVIAETNNHKPIFVALLRGAAPFATKLMFAIARQAPKFYPEIDYMMVSTYGDERQAGQPKIVKDLAPTTNIANRPVIILDDVLDKGITADFVAKHLRTLDASKISLAVLVDKQTNRQIPIEADYSCFKSEDVWLAGMGMDDSATANEAYRWSDAIFEIK